MHNAGIVYKIQLKNKIKICLQRRAGIIDIRCTFNLSFFFRVFEILVSVSFVLPIFNFGPGRHLLK